jgi:hypothetical protein
VRFVRSVSVFIVMCVLALWFTSLDMEPSTAIDTSVAASASRLGGGSGSRTSCAACEPYAAAAAPAAFTCPACPKIPAPVPRPATPASATARMLAPPATLPTWFLAGQLGPTHVTTRSLTRAEYSSAMLPHARAQVGEDRRAYEGYFWGVQGGTVLESGALDGKFLSVSWMLEFGAGWRSVLIDASPGNYAKMLQNRPNAVCLNIAMCMKPQTVHYVDGCVVEVGRNGQH